MIRVGFDDQIFIAQSRGGISKYFVEIISRLPSYGVEPVLLLNSTRNHHLAESGLVAEANGDTALQSKIRGFFWRLTGYPRYVSTKKNNVDLIHHTFTHKSYLGRLNRPSVVTVYDMIPEVYPEYFPLGNPHFAKKKYAEKCDRIISISDSTTRDMLQFYGKSIEDKTFVIPFGVGEQYLEPDMSVEMPVLPENYLLFVGVRRGYKEFATAFKAFEQIALKENKLHFVIFGGGRYSDDEREMITNSKFENRVIHFNPSDKQMPLFYQRASCFLFPSVYEGFGLPTLEALASGTPVVLADASCSREVGGDLAIYFEPGSVQGLVEAIGQARAKDWRQRIKLEGPNRAKEFNWDSVAEKTAMLYKQLLNH